jgi:hypothetical protein
MYTFRVHTGTLEAALNHKWVVLFAISVAFMLLTGCRNHPYDPVIWRTDLRSPDGAWLATAHTDQYGGFGSAYIDTVVTLKRLDGTINRGKPFDILEYPEGGPVRKAYTLSQENAGGGVNLEMRWLTLNHLEIDYSGYLNPDLQVVRFGGVEITLHQR